MDYKHDVFEKKMKHNCYALEWIFIFGALDDVDRIAVSSVQCIAKYLHNFQCSNEKDSIHQNPSVVYCKHALCESMFLTVLSVFCCNVLWFNPAILGAFFQSLNG